MKRFAYFRLVSVRLLTSLVLALLMASAGFAQAAEVLRVLAWPGYADPDIVRQFETRHQVRVEVTTIDSDSELWKKINRSQGKDFDVFAVNTAELQRYLRQDLLAPIPRPAIPNLSRQLPRFRDPLAVPGIVRDGKLFAVPYTYAEMGLIYDPKQFPTPPDSIAALWDPRYQGKVIAYNGGTHASRWPRNSSDNRRSGISEPGRRLSTA